MDLDGDISYSKLEEVDYDDSTHTVPDAVLPSRHNPRKQRIIQRATSSSAYVGMNGLLFIVNVWILLVSLNKVISLRRYCPEIPYTPAKGLLQYEHIALDLVSFNPYAGERTPEMDKAWETLKIYEIWRSTKDELKKSGAYEERSLPLEHGGYMAIMRAYHELHCLDWIKREWDPTRPLMTWHLDHCLDALRQGAMCKADLTVGSFYWWPKDPVEKERVRRPNFKRECVNWNSLEEFLAPRKMKFVNGVPEAPIGPDGNPIVVPPTDGLHTLNNAIVDGAQGDLQ
ncbi:MAG: hypothetical protein Q9167_004692 [Letrouitia subvulpina]